MLDGSANLNRIEQTKSQLTLLERELDAWLKRRKEADVRQQYHSQLETVAGTVRAALHELFADVSSLVPSRPAGELYEACRESEVRIFWLRRVWAFFRDKFDQRDDPWAGRLLQAADEVVWSCYRPCFLMAQAEDPRIVPGPAPLAFVEPHYSPAAFPRHLVPSDLRREVDLSFLEEHLKSLPVPLVRLPPSAVAVPWMLVYLGHEIGHQVEAALLPDRELEDLFTAEVERVVRERDEAAVERWRYWSHEIFADLYSVLMMGPWALWSMVELEVAQPAAMAAERGPLYPPAAVRLQLLAEMTRRLGLPAEDALRGLDPCALAEARPGAAADFGLASAVAAALVEFKVGGLRLQALSGFRPDDFETAVRGWKEALLGEDPPASQRHLKAARLATAGTVAAWAELAAAPAADTAQRREELGRKAEALISECREEGRRAAAAAVGDARRIGTDLGRALIARQPSAAEIGSSTLTAETDE